MLAASQPQALHKGVEMTHPYPQLQLILDDDMIARHDLPFSSYPDDPSPVKVEDGDLSPIVEWRSERVPPVMLPRTPAVVHYPRQVRAFVIQSGTDLLEQEIGFQARAIVVQNVGTNGVLYCPQLALYLTSAASPLVTYNLPYAIEKVSIQWHTAVFNPVSPGAVSGQWAIVWLYDDWIMPDTAASGGGSSGASVPTAANAAQTNVAQNAASVQLLAANTSRKGFSIYNDSASVLYLSFSGAASTANYKVQVAANGYFEASPEAVFTGAVAGIWAGAGAGNARITELS